MRSSAAVYQSLTNFTPNQKSEMASSWRWKQENGNQRRRSLLPKELISRLRCVLFHMMFYKFTEGEVIWLDTRRRETVWIWWSAVFEAVWNRRLKAFSPAVNIRSLMLSNSVIFFVYFIQGIRRRRAFEGARLCCLHEI